ncbi:MAG: formate dehydrogenase accessory protein FdhE [Syntrophobacteraceae bacterium]
MNDANTALTPEAAAQRIARALDAIKQELLPLKSIVEAFEELLIARARLKAELPPFDDLHVPPPDPARFAKGAPLTSVELLVADSAGFWEKAEACLMPAMERGFPKLRKDLSAIRQAVSEGRLKPDECLSAMVNGHEKDLQLIASRLSVSPEVLTFVVGQLAKPFLEKRAEALAPLIESLTWHRGYCPVCGSMPELSFLKEAEGQRWQRCSLCGQTWRFSRLACPFCETDDSENLQLYYIAGREHERAEICRNCGRYVLSLDLRGRIDETVLEVAPLGLAHLDLLAQEKGHLPAALCAWNIVRRQDITSSEVVVGPRAEPEAEQTC